jgi:hypothetical protein
MTKNRKRTLCLDHTTVKRSLLLENALRALADAARATGGGDDDRTGEEHDSMPH